MPNDVVRAGGLVRVSRRVTAPPPVEAFRCLRAAGHEPVLLHGAGPHPDARRSYLACDPLEEWRVEGDQWRVIRPDGASDRDDRVVVRSVDDPVQVLREALARVAHGLDEEGFSGGWVGYLGYEAGRWFEPDMPPPRQAPGTPDLVLRLCPTVLAYGPEGVVLHAADPEGDEAAATRRLERALRVLAGPAPADPAPEGGQAPGRFAHAAATAGTLPQATAGWRTDPDEPAFAAEVARLKDLIRDGDLFQANLATRFVRAFDADPADLFTALESANPSPYMALLPFHDHAVVSGSPELLVAHDARQVRARPIAGTRGRGDDDARDAAWEAELLADDKEDAEHTMLVDLVRNDLARVAVPGSVHVREHKSVERYSHVMHLVSEVRGDKRPDADAIDVLAATFPGGTITGAPKPRACLRIHEAEPVPRGPYTGSAGYIGWGGQATWNILIRTLVLRGGTASVHAGSGIVADSVPHREWKEAGRKAQALLDAATGRATGRPGAGAVARGGDWHPAPASPPIEARVLLIDNHDSFVHNLADQAAGLGADVRVLRNEHDPMPLLEQWAPTHLVLGPGPGRPEDAGATLRLARGDHGIPTLGVCLGHQAIGLAHGAQVVRTGPVHGKTAVVHHDGAGLFAGLPSPLEACRYHSLAVADLPEVLERTAWLEDGTVMAMRHRERPLWGLQFHPESFRTAHGMQVMQRFLEGP